MLDQHPIHSAVNRPHLIGGADRALVIVWAMVAVLAAASIGTVKGLCLCFAVWTGGVVLLRQLGKADPMMRQVYSRYFYQQRFYRAGGLPGTRVQSVPKSWK